MLTELTSSFSCSLAATLGSSVEGHKARSWLAHSVVKHSVVAPAAAAAAAAAAMARASAACSALRCLLCVTCMQHASVKKRVTSHFGGCAHNGKHTSCQCTKTNTIPSKQCRRTATAEVAPEGRLLAPGSSARFGRKTSPSECRHLEKYVVNVRSLRNGALLARLPAGR